MHSGNSADKTTACVQRVWARLASGCKSSVFVFPALLHYTCTACLWRTIKVLALESQHIGGMVFFLFTVCWWIKKGFGPRVLMIRNLLILVLYVYHLFVYTVCLSTYLFSSLLLTFLFVRIDPLFFQAEVVRGHQSWAFLVVLVYFMSYYFYVSDVWLLVLC